MTSPEAERAHREPMMRMRFLHAFAFGIGSLIAFRSTLPLIFRATAPGMATNQPSGVLLSLLLYVAAGLCGLMLRELLYGIAYWMKYREKAASEEPAR